MADTLNNVPIPVNVWVNAYALAGITLGEPINVENVGTCDIYASVQAAQPPPNHNSYRLIQRKNGVKFSTKPGDAGLWLFCNSSEGLVNIESGLSGDADDLPSTAFGELPTASLEPIIQISAQYGLLEDVIAPVINASASAIDSKFRVATNPATGSAGAIVSSREAVYRPGQGLVARFTALFTDGVAGSGQQAGLITSESGFSFGFDGVRFGILHQTDGSLELQRLTVTTPASGDETATVTIDGVPFSVPLSGGGSTQQDAYEIATSLENQVPGYSFSSVDDVVDCLAQLPDLGGGSFSFTSATADASFVSVTNGVLPAEEWFYKEDWNVRPDINIDPTLGNVYQIQMQYLGFGGISFFIEEPITGRLTLVHQIRYANSSLIPSVQNPVFRMGWACRNTTNNTVIAVEGASGAVFNEGAITITEREKGVCATVESVGSNRTNILAIKNRLIFNDITNRLEVLPGTASFATDSTKAAIFDIVLNPVVNPGEFLEYQLRDNAGLVEISTTESQIVDGEVIGCFVVSAAGNTVVDLSKVIPYLTNGESVSITARISSGSASEMNVSFNWQEDL